jgi:hypothetical protein
MLMTSSGRHLLFLGGSRAARHRTGAPARGWRIRRALAEHVYSVYDEAGRFIGTVRHPQGKVRFGNSEETVYVRRES